MSCVCGAAAQGSVTSNAAKYSAIHRAANDFPIATSRGTSPKYTPPRAGSIPIFAPLDGTARKRVASGFSLASLCRIHIDASPESVYIPRHASA